MQPSNMDFLEAGTQTKLHSDFQTSTTKIQTAVGDQTLLLATEKNGDLHANVKSMHWIFHTDVCKKSYLRQYSFSKE
jgi:hypothetical protein